MQGRYPQGVMITLSDCTNPADEADFNRWYDEVFAPGVEASPLVGNVLRYENAYKDEPTFRSHPKYLVITEVLSDDLSAAAPALRDLYTELRANRSAPELFKLDTLYERVGPEFHSERSDRPVRHVYCGLVGLNDITREDEFNQWYNDKHSPDALADAFDTGYRYRVVDPTEPVPHQASRYVSIYEISHDLGRLQEHLAAFRAEMIESDPLWVNLLAVYYSGIFSPLKTS